MLKKKTDEIEEEKKKKRISLFVWKKTIQNNLIKSITISNSKDKKKFVENKKTIETPKKEIKNTLEIQIKKEEKQNTNNKTNHPTTPTPIKKEIIESKEKRKNKPLIKQKRKPTKQNDKGKQFLLELAITTELETILKDQEYELNKLTIEYDILKKQTENIVEVKDLENKENKINELLKKLDEIKKQLETIINSSTFSNIYKLENKYLTNLIDEYKQNLKDNNILFEKVNSLENSDLYLFIFNELKNIEKDEEKLKKEIEEKKKEYEIRDETFEEWKDNYLDIEEVSKSLDNLVKESENYLKDIEEKVAQAVTVTEITETKIKSSLGIISQMLLLTALLKKNPTKKANGIVALEVLLTLNIINEIFKPETITKKHFESDIIDYKNLITNAINDVENVNNLIINSLETISELKDTYQKGFKEYELEIPEYQKLLDKLESIEKEMLERQNNMNKITNELAYQYDKNNQKVKKYQNLS